MILIALGSNVGDRRLMLRRARELLAQNGVEMKLESTELETQALLSEGAPPEWNQPFLNQVIAVETTLSPAALIERMQGIESALGRKNRGRWSPREIDLDLLAYHMEIISTERLTLPHPELHKRDFVLIPLMEVAPQWQHPLLRRTAPEMLAAL